MDRLALLLPNARIFGLACSLLLCSLDLGFWMTVDAGFNQRTERSTYCTEVEKFFDRKKGLY